MHDSMFNKGHSQKIDILRGYFAGFGVALVVAGHTLAMPLE